MSPIALQADRDVSGVERPPANQSGSPGVVSFGTRHEVLQRGLPWLLLSSGLVLGLVDHEFTRRFAVAPFMVSLLLFGMPHGAMDWVVNNRLQGLRSLPRQLQGFLGYLGWMAVSVILLVFAPFVTIAAFMALTILHFGLADLYATRNDGSSLGFRIAFIASRGLLVLGPAFAFHTAEAWYPFGLLIGTPVLEASSVAAISTVSWIGTILGLGTATVLAGIRMRSDSTRRGTLDLVESLLVFGMVAATSPLFGVGLFFVSTHAFRHSIRLSTTPEVGGEPEVRHVLLGLWRMHMRSMPLLVPTFAIIVVWSLIQFGDLSATHLTVVTIGFFIISTLPHHLLGLRLPVPSRRARPTG